MSTTVRFRLGVEAVQDLASRTRTPLPWADARGRRRPARSTPATGPPGGPSSIPRPSSRTWGLLSTDDEVDASVVDALGRFAAPEVLVDLVLGRPGVVLRSGTGSAAPVWLPSRAAAPLRSRLVGPAGVARRAGVPGQGASVRRRPRPPSGGAPQAAGRAGPRERCRPPPGPPGPPGEAGPAARGGPGGRGRPDADPARHRARPVASHRRHTRDRAATRSAWSAGCSSPTAGTGGADRPAEGPMVVVRAVAPDDLGDRVARLVAGVRA